LVLIDVLSRNVSFEIVNKLYLLVLHVISFRKLFKNFI